MGKERSFVTYDSFNKRRHVVDEDDVHTVFARLPAETLSRLERFAFNDKRRWGTFGYVDRGRRNMALCAQPERFAIPTMLNSGKVSPSTYGAVYGTQAPTIAQRRFMLYQVLLHEVGHLQVVVRRPHSQFRHRDFALEAKAQSFAEYWRKRLWSEHFDHPDPVHNAPSDAEMEYMRESWVPAHKLFKRGMSVWGRKKGWDKEQAQLTLPHFEAALEVCPTHQWALLEAGRMCLVFGIVDRELEHCERALSLVQRALAVDPRTLGGRWLEGRIERGIERLQ